MYQNKDASPEIISPHCEKLSGLSPRNPQEIAKCELIDWMEVCTNYGHPERALFKNSELLGLGRQIGLEFF